MKRYFSSYCRRINGVKNWLPIALMFFLFGCSRQPESGRVLASAGNSKLYLNEVSKHVDTTSAYAVRNYVSNWVDEQLLYDEAEKQGINNTPEFRERINQFSRQLAITVLLNQKVYGAAIDLTPQEITDFYNTHREELRATDNIAFVNLAAFDRRSFAVAFRNALVSGASWASVFGDIPTYAILDEKDSVYLRASDANTAIWNVIQSLHAGGISFPIQVDSLNYVVQVIQKLKTGDPLPLGYASPRIKERVIIEKRRQLYHSLLDSLRAAGNFQIDPSVAIKDTSVQE